MSVLAVVNEGSTAWLDVSFFDSAGAASTPSAVSYSIVDGRTGAVVRAATSVTPASIVTITLTPADNDILVEGSVGEERLVTVTATHGAGDVKTEEYRYQVRALRGVA